MLGGIVGGIIGSIYERSPNRSKTTDFSLFDACCTFLKV